MARKASVSSSSKSAPKAAAKKPVASTPVRNSPIPKVAKATPAAVAAPAVISHEMIAVRAFEISCGPSCGSEFDNWVRAERELRGV
jgi:hypothetical protein